MLTAFLPVLPGEVREQPLAAQRDPEHSSLEAFLELCLNSHPGDQYAEAHRQLDRMLLTRVLREADGNQQQSARRLGIGRETLRRRLRELGLQVNRQLSIDEDDQA